MNSNTNNYDIIFKKQKKIVLYEEGWNLVNLLVIIFDRCLLRDFGHNVRIKKVDHCLMSIFMTYGDESEVNNQWQFIK